MSKSGKHETSKAAFIRSLSAKIPDKKVVELGLERGFKLTPQYVYNVRWADRATRKKKVMWTVPGQVPSAAAARTASKPPRALQAAAASIGDKRDARIQEIAFLVDRLVADGVRSRLKELAEKE